MNILFDHSRTAVMRIVQLTYAPNVMTTSTATIGLKLRARSAATRPYREDEHISNTVRCALHPDIRGQLVSRLRVLDERQPEICKVLHSDSETEIVTSSTMVGMKVNTMARNMTAIDRVPRSKTRDKAPVRRSKWKLMSRSSTCANVWYATRRPAACELARRTRNPN